MYLLFLFLISFCNGNNSPFISKDNITHAFEYDFDCYWTGGSNLIYGTGTLTKYYTRAVISARYGTAVWMVNTDTTSLMVVFGGYRFYPEGSLNDMYKSTDNGKTWYWIYGCDTVWNQGSYPLEYNMIAVPRSRDYSHYWRFGDYLYLFGGHHHDNSMSDLFKISINSIVNDNPKFYWIGGCDEVNYGGSYLSYDVPGTIPRSRYQAMTWMNEEDTVFIYAGWSSGGFISDSFSYSTKNESSFVWISGCNVDVVAGYYPDEYNNTGIPPPRYGGNTWYSNANNRSIVCLFGGDNGIGRFNDLWVSYNDGRVWYWMNGCNQINNQGTYDSIGFNYPANRALFSSFIINVDNGNNINSYAIFYGGANRPNSSAHLRLSDWWLFDFDTFNFTLLRGSNNFDKLGTYPSAYNQIGTFGALYAYSMFYFNDYIYVLFGYGFATESNRGFINSMWKIQIYDIVKDIIQTSFTFTTRIVFGILAGVFLIFLLIFFIFKSELLYYSSSQIVQKDKFFLIFSFIGIINFISDILLLFPTLLVISFFSSTSQLVHIILFFASLSVFILSIIINFFGIRKFFLQNIHYDNQEYSYLAIIFYLSALISPSFSYILISFTFNSLKESKDKNNLTICNFCTMNDYYSVLPQTIILLYYLFVVSTINDWNLLVYIVLLCKFISIVSAIARTSRILYFGGGKGLGQNQGPKLKYGIFRRVGTNPVPKLTSSSTLSVIELSSTDNSISLDSSGSYSSDSH